ncbi:MAG: hypothetical protein DRJ42_24140 [Deltaproteobacteria bacterium]|nr:MAG: hypothetical protein DRJ42_24140 [Deltaproteobacteria bacterium]
MKTLTTLFIAALTALAMACGGSADADTAESQSAGDEMSTGDEMAADETGDEYAEEDMGDEAVADDGMGDEELPAEEAAPE